MTSPSETAHTAAPYRALRQHRRRGDAINDTIRAVAVLHNLKIDNV
ncbi:hypothetical protein ACWDYJ_14950 [Streptomyces sp. NPDC003042]